MKEGNKTASTASRLGYLIISPKLQHCMSEPVNNTHTDLSRNRFNLRPIQASVSYYLSLSKANYNYTFQALALVDHIDLLLRNVQRESEEHIL